MTDLNQFIEVLNKIKNSYSPGSKLVLMVNGDLFIDSLDDFPSQVERLPDGWAITPSGFYFKEIEKARVQSEHISGQ